MQKVLEKKELKSFVLKLMENNEVVAPVKKEITKFGLVKSPDEIYLKEITLVPAKEFFIPEEEVLFGFKNNKINKNTAKEKKRIIFGLRKCDLNAIRVLDNVMFDPLYVQKRKEAILIGIYCDSPDKHCFCNSMELEDYYDLFFYPHKDKYYISIGSKKGGFLVKDLKDADEEIKKEIINYKRLENKDIEPDYGDGKWNEDVKKCLSCGACTIYCPTCNCFDIKDRKNISLKEGERIRTQTSCQLKSFSEVGGGKVFRDSRASRFKHFVYHKIVFYKKRFGRYMCVGCGRCLRACPPEIDWVETMNSIKKARKK